MSSKIYVGNISATTSEKDLFDLFGKYGEVISAKITFGIDNQNTRHGYVVMSDETKAKRAIEKTHNYVFNGNRIKVVMAHPIDQREDYFTSQNRYTKFRKR